MRPSHIACPHCDSRFTIERMGLSAYFGSEPVPFTVHCPVCTQAFDGEIRRHVETTTREVVDRKGWFGWFRKTHVETDAVDEHRVTTRAR